MTRLRKLFVVMAIALLWLAFADSRVAWAGKTRPTANNNAASANKTAAPAMKWDSNSELMFARLMCVDGEYFRECFTSSKTDCEIAMKQESRVCDRDRAKKKFNSEVELFAEIGVCAGTQIEKKWRDRKSTSSKCDRKENWQ